jgi:hypothetical protein
LHNVLTQRSQGCQSEIAFMAGQSSGVEFTNGDRPGVRLREASLAARKASLPRQDCPTQENAPTAFLAAI